MEYYPRTRSDVYRVAFLLRQKLVADLVPIVLDEAQYWTKRTVSTERSRTVSEAPEGKRVLRTEPLSAAEHRRVRLVRFATRSVAQCFDRSVWDRPQSPSCGACDENKQLGSVGEVSDTSETASIASSVPSRPSSPLSIVSTPSSCSDTASVHQADLPKNPVDAKSDRNKKDAFTWFEAHVTAHDAPDNLYPDASSWQPGGMRAGAPRAEGQHADDGPRLISNCNTEESLTDYQAVWRWDAEEREERLAVRSIGKGDVLDLTSHCSVFGWENFLKHAEIEMFFGYIR